MPVGVYYNVEDEETHPFLRYASLFGVVDDVFVSNHKGSEE